jgi:hypothetical protein
MKRGSIMDVLAIILVLAVGISSFYVATIVTKGFTDAVNQTSTGQSYFYNQSYISSKGNAAFNAMNLMIPILVMMAGVAGIVFAFLIPSHPIFLPLSIFALLFLIVVASVFSDTLTQFTHSAGIVATANAYSLNEAVIANLPFIVAIFGFIIIVVMYSRGSSVEI